MSTIASADGASNTPFGGPGSPYPGRTGTGHPVDPWAAAHTSAEFTSLRRRLRGFVFPMTAFFLAWYFLYVLSAAFAPQFMAIKVIGNINIGLLFGLLQFISTFAITTIYVRFANRDLDPTGNLIRERLEGTAC
jgi:uncharacterized membrane protein (DUF485 family)